MDNDKYNGWTNYETWTVALWIDNEQSSYGYWRDEARRHYREAIHDPKVAEGIWTVEAAAQYRLADQLAEEFAEHSPIADGSVYGDLLTAALSEVNWQEIAKGLLEDVEPPEHPVFGPVVFSYSRAQAFADGVLVDVTKTAQEAGIVYPTAITETIYSRYVRVPDGVPCQDEEGRLWDILYMFHAAAKQCTGSDTLTFAVWVVNERQETEEVTLKAVCGPGDNPEPVITIMLPQED